jgi:hypothetical protein
MCTAELVATSISWGSAMADEASVRIKLGPIEIDYKGDAVFLKKT